MIRFNLKQKYLPIFPSCCLSVLLYRCTLLAPNDSVALEQFWVISEKTFIEKNWSRIKEDNFNNEFVVKEAFIMATIFFSDPEMDGLKCGSLEWNFTHSYATTKTEIK